MPRTGLAVCAKARYAQRRRAGEPMMSRKFAALSALVAAAALAATAGFAAVTAAPDPAQMALLAEDIPDSKVKGKRLKPDKGYVAAYARDFELTKPYGSSQLVFI